MKRDFLIIGGGVAGLAAANRLAECGAAVTLLEGGAYPAHKICGEFLSPEAIPLLENWDIAPTVLIRTLKLVMPKSSWSMQLPKETGSISRYILDAALAKRAQKRGCEIKTEAQVKNIKVPKNDQDHFIVTLASGEEWTSKKLLISTGRLTNQSPPKFCYVGAKAHFEGIDLSELQMYLMKDAYFGMSSIGVNQVNVAGLIRCTAKEAQSPNQVLAEFLGRREAKPLQEILTPAKCLFDAFMTSPVPEFGIRNTPKWPNAYFLGDAAGVIPPATGNGLAMAITSGILAAEYAMKEEPDSYRLAWNREYSRRIERGMLLHRLFLSPRLAQAIPWVTRLFPALPSYCFRATRASG